MIHNDAIQTLADLPRVQATQFPDTKALIFRGHELTYRQLELHSNRVATALLNSGIQAGSRVAILAKDSLSSYEILFGCAKIGAVLVPINWRLTAPEISYILQDAEVELLFVGAQFSKLIESIQPELKHIKTTIALQSGEQSWPNYENWLQNGSETDPNIPIHPEQVAVQMYTSGTTGHPKGVQLAHYSFFAIAKAFAQNNRHWIGWNHQDRSLITLPLFHIGGVWWAIRGLVAGAENVLLEAFIPTDALQAIATYRITKTCLVPAMIQAMLAEPSCHKTDFSSLDTIVYGGSPIAEMLLTKAIATFDCDFVQIYGMTETGNCVVSLVASDHISGPAKRLQAAGQPFPGVSIAILNAKGAALP